MRWSMVSTVLRDSSRLTRQDIQFAKDGHVLPAGLPRNVKKPLAEKRNHRLSENTFPMELSML